MKKMKELTHITILLNHPETMVFTTLYQKMCCLINTCEYIFFKCI